MVTWTHSTNRNILNNDFSFKKFNNVFANWNLCAAIGLVVLVQKIINLENNPTGVAADIGLVGE